MVSSRRRVSPRVARQRALLADLICGVLLAILAIAIAAGIGVVAVGAVLALLVTSAWVGIERALALVRRRSTDEPQRLQSGS
jgi:hypothetical protein